MELSFYKNIPVLAKFEQLSGNDFLPLPRTWFVVITDIRNSTEAVAQGRYRDVNMLGAASISRVQDVFKGDEIPYVFGGDGATFLIPSEKIEEVKTVLADLIAYAETQFKLKLLVGVVGLDELYEAGQELKVARFELMGGKPVALFSGGGLVFAENLVKTFPRKYGLKAPTGSTTANIEGLSCRWQPVRATNGEIISVIAQPRVYGMLDDIQSILSEINRIVGGDLEQANPIKASSLRYKGLFSAARSEWATTQNKFSRAFLGKLVEIFMCVLVFKFRFPAPKFFRDYESKLPQHTDYRKFDDVLRLTLDATKTQTQQIRELLEDRFQKQKIFYGTHTSSHALMTCLVKNNDLQDGAHIHFVDGSDGGYSRAAVNLRAQIKSARAEQPTL